MDTKKLEALATAVQTGSFTRAAEVLGYTQSGLTHMMNSLEKDIGFPLLVRSRTGIRLSAAGQRVFPMIQDLLRADETLEREIRLINTRREETIRVASYASIAMHWLPEIIQRFRDNHPDVAVDVQMGSVEEVYHWVQEDKADMCFASWQEWFTLDWTHLRNDPLLVILPPDYDMQGRESLKVQSLQGMDFLMPSPGFYLDIMHALGDVKPNIRETHVSDSVIISMVEHGLGASILSELVLKGRRDNVVAVPMDPPAVRELGIAVRSKKELRPMARRFISETKEILESI